MKKIYVTSDLSLETTKKLFNVLHNDNKDWTIPDDCYRCEVCNSDYLHTIYSIDNRDIREVAYWCEMGCIYSVRFEDHKGNIHKNLAILKQ